jgi:hypothetical protein
MKYCELSDIPPTDYKGYYGWCVDHNLPADHCGPDGDTPVCEKFTEEDGCNCCPENFKRRENVQLTDGRWVPKVCVEALTELEERWPGATFVGARSAIAAAVLESIGHYDKENDNQR